MCTNSPSTQWSCVIVPQKTDALALVLSEQKETEPPNFHMVTHCETWNLQALIPRSIKILLSSQVPFSFQSCLQPRHQHVMKVQGRHSHFFGLWSNQVQLCPDSDCHSDVERLVAMATPACTCGDDPIINMIIIIASFCWN